MIFLHLTGLSLGTCMSPSGGLRILILQIRCRCAGFSSLSISPPHVFCTWGVCVCVCVCVVSLSLRVCARQAELPTLCSWPFCFCTGIPTAPHKCLSASPGLAHPSLFLNPFPPGPCLGLLPGLTSSNPSPICNQRDVSETQI